MYQKHNLGRRIVSMMLAMLMVFALMPAGVFADNAALSTEKTESHTVETTVPPTTENTVPPAEETPVSAEETTVPPAETTAPPAAETPAAAEEITAAPTENTVPAAEQAPAPKEETTDSTEKAPVSPAIRTLTIGYFFDGNLTSALAGTQAAQPHVETLAEGETYSVASPVINGFAPDSATVAGTVGTENINITVVYSPADVTYTVNHYRQKVSGNDYTLDETTSETGKTGNLTTAVAIAKEGFTAKAFEQAEIAADGSTAIDIYYDRNVHFVKYSTNGGNYVDTVSARYGETVPVAEKTTKTGYEFAGWYLDAALNHKADASVTMGDADIILYAKFVPKEQVPYTVVYLQEGLTAGQYDFKEKGTLYAPIGAEVDVKDGKIVATLNSQAVKSEPLKNYPYFSYQKADKVTVAADGSTVFNVYYTRNSYTFSFDVNTEIIKASIKIGDQTYGKTYSFTAKLGEDVASRWPTAENIIHSAVLYDFEGWNGPGSNNYVSKRFHVVGQMIDNNEGTAQAGATISYKGIWKTNLKTVMLHYMLENATDDNFTDSELYRQTANATGTFSPKAINGFDNSTYNKKNYVQEKDGIDHYYFYYKRLSNTIAFDTRGGTPKDIDPITARFEAPVAAPAAPAKTGYTFGGWYAGDPTCSGTPFTFGAMPANNVILYAKWVPKQYTVTFDAKGGSAVDAQTVNYRTPLNEAAASTTKNGYTFGGWYVSEDFTGTPYVFDKPVESSFTLYARWYAKNTATVSITHTPTDNSGAFAGKNTTLTGQTITGTVTAQSVLVEKYAPDAVSKSIVVDADDAKNVIDFQYTHFESLSYTVRYLDQDGKDLLPSENGATTGLARATVNYKQIAGYTPDAYQKTLVLVADTTKNVITFVYTPLQKVQYTVAHYVQKEGLDYERKDVETFSVAPGTPVSAAAKTYDGHAYNKNISTPAAVVTSDGKTELKFYYDWHYYHITYDVNGDTGAVTDTSSYRHGTTAAVKSITGVTPPAHTDFAGWKLGSTVYKAGDTIENITANLTLTAQWTPKPQYTVVYRCEGNENLPADKFYRDDTITVKKFAETGFKLPESKKFTHWVDESGKIYTPDAQMTISGNKIFTAHLVDKKIITVTYQGNGGKKGEDTTVVDATHYEDAKYKILGNMFTYPGYTFTEWQGGVTGAEITLKSDITLTAQWKKDNSAWATLTYDANGGTGKVPSALEVLKGKNVTVASPENLTREKAILLGWSKTKAPLIKNDADIPALVLAGDVFALKENTTLYAVWAQDEDEDKTPDYDEFKVIYHGNGNDAGSVPTDAHLYSGKEGDDTATVLGRADLAKANAVFLGWSLKEYPLLKTQEEENAAHILTAGNTLRIVEMNIDLHAVWALDANGPDKKPDEIPDYKEFSVTYAANNGTNASVSNGAIYPAGYTVTVAQNSFVHEGYTFSTWNTQADGKGTSAQPDHKFAIERSTIFYAQWNKIPAPVVPTPTPTPEEPVVTLAVTPKTGDNTPVISLAASMAMALAAFCVLAAWRKRTSL